MSNSLPAPEYERASSSAGIAHIGVGNFHRAHQAMVVDRLLRAGEARGWAICGIGLLPGDARMRDALAEQDHLYTLTLAHPGGERETTVIGSIVDYVFAPDDWAATVERLAAPGIRIVSLTITEGGYRLDLGDPSRSAFALICDALRLRRERGVRPFTVMSCDNIQHNGHVARETVLEYARPQDPELAEWIAAEVAFPSSMVDRITPVTAPQDPELLRERTGLIDAWPVTAEPFFQWVLEDDFPAGRPAFEKAGVQIVDDVAPYEYMKLRLLNAGHQLIAHTGLLLGLRFADEAMTDADIARYFRAYEREEAVPTLPPVPGVDLDAYIDTLIDRFSSTAVQDTLERLATDAVNRLRVFVVPVIRDTLATGRECPLAIGIIAFWSAASNNPDPRPVVDGLADDPRFAETFSRILQDATTGGLRAALARLVPPVVISDN
jgi:mannitol 2-dehydrogenase